MRERLKKMVAPLRHTARKIGLRNDARRSAPLIDYTGQQAQDYLANLLGGDRPAMVCRFGRTELEAMLQYSKLVSGYHEGYRYTADVYERLFHELKFYSGFYPVQAESVARFYHRMMEDILEIDVLGSWLRDERYLKAQLEGAARVGLHDLDPVIKNHPHPWTGILKDKRVLVVHPFETTIKSQYRKRSLLFENPETLPPFELLTLKAIQNPDWQIQVGNDKQVGSHKARGPFETWFDALKYMEDEIAVKEFDIALIGCGAYGLPLAAHVKRLGSKGVHLGGVTQMLFGIKGKRWLNNYGFTGYNEHWVFPYPEDTPTDVTHIEKGGPYW